MARINAAMYRVYEYIDSLAFNHRLRSGEKKILKSLKNFYSGIRAVTYYLFRAIKRKDNPKKLGQRKYYKFFYVLYETNRNGIHQV